MFLSVLSGAIVALALAAQADDFGGSFRLFALVILPVVLMVGIGTILRLRISNYHDAICVIGMNRIRAGYLELAPGLDRYFVMGTTDDQRGVSLTMAVAPNTSIVVQMLASTPFTVMLLNGILAAAIGALLVIQVGGGTAPALAVAALAFAITLYAFVVTARRSIDRSRRDVEPIFPTQDGEAA